MAAFNTKGEEIARASADAPLVGMEVFAGGKAAGALVLVTTDGRIRILRVSSAGPP